MTQVHQETPAGRTLILQVPGWSGHDAGQHGDLRMRLPDRSFADWPYSIASARGQAAST